MEIEINEECKLKKEKSNINLNENDNEINKNNDISTTKEDESYITDEVIQYCSSPKSGLVSIDNSNNSYMKILHELNYKNIDNKNNNNDKKDTDNNDINNNMMKLSTNFYLPNTIKKEKRERPKSINNLNIGVIMDKKNIRKDSKIKQLNTKKKFYQKKKLNKNFSQGNIQSKNKTKINGAKNTNNEKEPYQLHHKSLSKTKVNKENQINKINKSKTIVRNNSIKRNKLNLPQKKIPVPKTSGKKFTRKKLDTKMILNINSNNKFNCNSNTINAIYTNKNFANTTKGKTNYYMKKCDTNNLCKNLLNELSFNNNDIYSFKKYQKYQ